MFVNKNFIYLTCAYVKMLNELKCEIFRILCLCEDEDIGRF